MQPLSGGLLLLCGFQHVRNFNRQYNKNEVACEIEIVLTASINYTDEVILLCLFVRDDFMLVIVGSTVQVRELPLYLLKISEKFR